MYFYKNLYVSPSIENPEVAKRKIKNGEGQFTVYVVALSPSSPGPGSNQLEIMHSVNLKQPYYSKYPPYIIALTTGREEAIEYVRSLVQEAYEQTGSADVRNYLFPHGAVAHRLYVRKKLPKAPEDT